MQGLINNCMRNILVILYEGGIEPEVERNIFISFRKTLRGMKTKEVNHHAKHHLN